MIDVALVTIGVLALAGLLWLLLDRLPAWWDARQTRIGVERDRAEHAQRMQDPAYREEYEAAGRQLTELDNERRMKRFLEKHRKH